MAPPLSPQERSILSDSVNLFIREHIHSVEQLEVLLLLQRFPDREWTAQQVNEVLKSDEGSLRVRLLDLNSKQLISLRVEGRQGFFKFSVDSTIHKSVEELKECYKVFTVRVIEAIYRRPNDSFKDFSEAFRLGSKK